MTGDAMKPFLCAALVAVLSPALFPGALLARNSPPPQDFEIVESVPDASIYG